jgi:membrane peptidoglycan carboxypeptidase
MMEGVVEYGTGQAAQLDGYTAAGKTGTAQKIDPDGRYSHTHYVASFAGFAPASHPAITILVSIDTPVGGYYGAEVAAPAWQQIAQQTLSYLNIRHDAPLASPKSPVLAAMKSWGGRVPGYAGDLEQGLTGVDPPEASADPPSQDPPAARPDPVITVVSAGPSVTVPDFTGLDERKVARECQALGLALAVSGSGLAVRQTPAAGAGVPAGSEVQVAFAR